MKGEYLHEPQPQRGAKGARVFQPGPPVVLLGRVGKPGLLSGLRYAQPWALICNPFGVVFREILLLQKERPADCHLPPSQTQMAGRHIKFGSSHDVAAFFIGQYFSRSFNNIDSILQNKYLNRPPRHDRFGGIVANFNRCLCFTHYNTRRQRQPIQ